MTTHYHSRYWAHALSLRGTGGTIENLSRSIDLSRVELDGHAEFDPVLPRFRYEAPVTRGRLG